MEWNGDRAGRDRMRIGWDGDRVETRQVRIGWERVG